MIRGKMIDFDDGRVTHGLNDVLEFTARHSCEYLGLLFEKETLPQAGRGNKANAVMRALSQRLSAIYIGCLGTLIQLAVTPSSRQASVVAALPEMPPLTWAVPGRSLDALRCPSQSASIPAPLFRSLLLPT
jgi:hypothetical protein